MMRLLPLPALRPLAAVCLAPISMVPISMVPVSIVALSLAVLSAPLSAKDLGARGATWPIAEPDLLARIEARLAEMERSGALARFEAEARERARELLEEPAPVPGIAPARQARSWTFDPSISVARDIRTGDGVLIAAAGTRIDPLAHVPLTRDLLFIDGRREVEVAWALAHGRPAKIVLLAGRPLDLARRHGRMFHFDQGGRLAERLGLRATPSLVARDDTRAGDTRAGGALLRIEEIPLDDTVEDGRDTRAGDTRAGARQ